MQILIIGNRQQLEETQLKFGESHSYTLLPDHKKAQPFLKDNSVVFDFLISQSPLEIEIYQPYYSLVVFANSTLITLSSLTTEKHQSIVFGFCGMPTFLNREVFEVTTSNQNHRKHLERICHDLETKYLVVADKVGFVTPRVICMIINEAYYTVEEGTATREDIDIAMKLGTNYPYGPFEWSRKIGVKNIYRLLDAVYKDTNDERYKISSLLVSEAK